MPFRAQGDETAVQRPIVRLFTLEHGKFAYWADFAVYGVILLGLTAGSVIAGSGEPRWLSGGLVLAGLVVWSLIEYALHRFIFHGPEPFSTWHAEHHRRPTALIGTPTILSVALAFALLFLPVWMLAGLWCACSLTFGILSGYLAYAITHHLVHHSRCENAWLRRRRHWHALHHRRIEADGYYGVTSGFWDYFFTLGRRLRWPHGSRFDRAN